jgi:nucleoside-diphosphate-sugar epimerase
MTTALVVGGSYFIGRAVVLALADAGFDVWTLNRGTKEEPDRRVKRLIADRTNGKELRSSISRPFDIVVDVSALTGVEVQTFFRAIAWRPSRYILISSGAVYDSRLCSIPFNEDAKIGGDPIWAEYGADKTAAENAALQDCSSGAVYILRPPYVYGPANYLEREQFIWSRVQDRKPIYIPKGTRSTLQFCHVDDLASTVLAMAAGNLSEPGIYNIGDERAYGFREYIDLLSNIVGVRPDIRDAPDSTIPPRKYFPFRDYSLVLDTAKWRRVHAQKRPLLSDGLAQTYRWMRDNEWIKFTETDCEALWRAERP